MNARWAYPSRTDWVRLACVVVGGLVAGILAKAADESTISGVADLGTYFGVWVVLLALIATWARRADAAAVYGVGFALAMLVGYYTYTRALGMYVPPTLVVAWAGLGLVLVPPFAVLVHYARHSGWVAALGAAVPAGILLAEARAFVLVLPLHQLQFIFDVVAALLLLLLLPRSMTQRVRAVVLVVPCAFLAYRALDLVWRIADRAM